MGKIWVEISLISARGLRQTSPLWKLQWYAVGWINPGNKYCTTIDSSSNGNPVWKTRFSTEIDSTDPELQDLALHVEVYSREPCFLRQSLLGSATIILKEFLDKYDSKSEVSEPVEEIGSFQLRKKNSNKPRGFIDASIRISKVREEPSSSYLGGGEEGFNLANQNGGIINLASEYGSMQSLRPNPSPFPPNYSHRPPQGGPNYPPAGGHSYQPPPPQPPPSNVGYTPNFFPMANYAPSSSYINMPASVAPPPQRDGGGPGFGMGVGAGALAGGALIFGDNFLSGFDIPGSSRDTSVTISTHPPF